MASFATPAELASWLQVATVDTASAQLALDVASGVIRSFCGWPISEETVTDKTLDGPGGRSIWLPTLRLTAVGAVVENGNSLAVTTDFDWTSYGRLIRNGCWPATARSVVVTYTHGYATVPADVKGACLALAGRLFTNPGAGGALRAFTNTVGGVTESKTFAGTSGDASMLTATELTQLGPYRLEWVA